MRDGERVYWVGTRLDEAPRHVALADLPETEAALIDRVLEGGTPAGLVPGRICVPIQVVGRTIGAMVLSSEAGAGYTHQDNASAITQDSISGRSSPGWISRRERDA